MFGQNMFKYSNSPLMENFLVHTKTHLNTFYLETLMEIGINGNLVERIHLITHLLYIVGNVITLNEAITL